MYILEGNNGSGKSTLLKLIQKHMPEITTVQEPVNAWHGKNHTDSLLHNFYHDTPRWSYTMEMFTLAKRIKEHLKEQQNPDNKIMERSLYSGHYVFAKNGYEQKFMSRLEWNIYQKWFNFLVKEKCTPPTGFIYLCVPPEVCQKRIEKRSRPGEEIIPFNYTLQMHEKHEQFLIHKKDILPSLKDVPVLKLDLQEEFSTNPEIYSPALEKIKNFIQKTQAQKLFFKLNTECTITKRLTI